MSREVDHGCMPGELQNLMMSSALRDWIRSNAVDGICKKQVLTVGCIARETDDMVIFFNQNR